MRIIYLVLLLAVCSNIAMAQVTCDEGPDAIDIQFAEAGVVVLARVESTKLVSKMDPATGIRLPTELSRIKVTKTFKGKSRGWRDIFVFADTSEHPSLWLGTTYLFFLSDIGELKNCNNIVFNLQRDRAKLTKLNHLAHSR